MSTTGELTGGVLNGEILRTDSTGWAVVTNDLVSSADFSRTAGTTGYNYRWRPSADARAREQKAASAQASRYALGLLLRRALEDTDAFAEAIDQADLYDCGIFGCKVEESLKEAWRLRAARERHFSSLLNMLQGSIARMAFEHASRKQAEAVAEVLRILAAPQLDRNHVRRGMRALREGSLDPWRGISGDSPVAEDGDE